ncbi:hypothetical protein L596_001177 [Steinernema carpocapsae]|uniref:Uncharacterized protein n=1 Tax=Steinernema carpocapsae TaxID=34508 RepID=A0A4U8UMK2_STECR|nr:hypothetical protein L596_001177 [Steinernema carpocapsae]
MNQQMPPSAANETSTSVAFANTVPSSERFVQIVGKIVDEKTIGLLMYNTIFANIQMPEDLWRHCQELEQAKNRLLFSLGKLMHNQRIARKARAMDIEMTADEDDSETSQQNRMIRENSLNDLFSRIRYLLKVIHYKVELHRKTASLLITGFGMFWGNTVVPVTTNWFQLSVYPFVGCPEKALDLYVDLIYKSIEENVARDRTQIRELHSQMNSRIINTFNLAPFHEDVKKLMKDLEEKVAELQESRRVSKDLRQQLATPQDTSSSVIRGLSQDRAFIQTRIDSLYSQGKHILQDMEPIFSQYITKTALYQRELEYVIELRRVLISFGLC